MSSKDHSKKAVAKAKAKNNRLRFVILEDSLPQNSWGLRAGLGYRVCDGAEAGGLGFKVIGVEVWG